ncbi:MAG: hypothetical protein JNM09_22285 [Blastocatellia bacterium]|nr:hypothetical protein [Blastocatellia bacterium]
MSTIMNRKREFPGEGKWGGRFVIQTTTSGPINDNYSKQGYLCNDWFPSRRLRPVFDNLLANNQQTYSLHRNFSITNQYTMLSTRHFANFFKTEGPFVGYENFHKKYGQRSAYYTLSRVGFNPQKTKALVYVFERSTPISAFSRFIQLNKIRGKWSVAKEFGC